MQLKERLIRIGNTAYRVLFNDLTNGVKLTRDTDVKELIEVGYEGNSSVFGIAMKMAVMYASIPEIWYKGEKELDYNPMEILFEANNADYTYFEHKVMWHLFGMMTGESIVTYDKLKNGGNNNGQLSYFDIIPSQNVEIQSKGWRDPVGMYKIDLDDGEAIPPDKIWHTRFFPNLDFTGGKNFRGLSPLRVARNIIEADNNGQEFVAQSAGSGLPPGILVEKGGSQPTGIRQNKLINVWRRKYANRKNKAEPIVTQTSKDGGIDWIPMGFSNLKDLQIIENSENGLRKLCSIWSVPSRLFNDKDGATYNNRKTDEQAIYTNRLIPDTNLRHSGYNKLFKDAGIWVKADYSQIESLQEDRKDTVQRLTLGFDRGLVLENEWRKANGLEELTPEELEVLRLMVSERRGGYLPLTTEEQQQAQKYLNMQQ